MEKLIVVGEKFTDFARRHQNVLTVNEFERFVWSGELAGVDKIVIGQGVQLDDISRTVCIIRQHYPDKIRQIVNLQDLYYQNNRDHQRLVHKRKKENILITSPEKRDEDSYCARLILQDASELLCDHQTGTRKAEVGFSFSVYDLNYITRKECEQAALCHQHYLVSIEQGDGDEHRLF
ncbi:hypothetical protein ACXEIX_002252 [Klebsiella variicola]